MIPREKAIDASELCWFCDGPIAPDDEGDAICRECFPAWFSGTLHGAVEEDEQ